MNRYNVRQLSINHNPEHKKLMDQETGVETCLLFNFQLYWNMQILEEEKGFSGGRYKPVNYLKEEIAVIEREIGGK